MQLDKIANQITVALGNDLPFMDREPSGAERECLDGVFGDSGFQAYMEDQINRRMITDYLMNAMLQGYIDHFQLAHVLEYCRTPEDRVGVAIQMLMASVTEASSIVESVLDIQEIEQPTPTRPALKVVG